MSRAALLPFFSPREIIPTGLAAAPDGVLPPQPRLSPPRAGRSPSPLPHLCHPSAPGKVQRAASCAGGAGLGTELRGTGAAEPEQPGQEPGGPGGTTSPIRHDDFPVGGTHCTRGQGKTALCWECKTSVCVPAREGGQGLPQGRVKGTEQLRAVLAQSFQEIFANQLGKQFPLQYPSPAWGRGCAI